MPLNHKSIQEGLSIKYKNNKVSEFEKTSKAPFDTANHVNILAILLYYSIYVYSVCYY